MKSMKFLGVINPGNLAQDNNMHYTTALFLMVSDWKQPQSSSTGDCLNKVCTSAQWNTIQPLQRRGQFCVYWYGKKSQDILLNERSREPKSVHKG